MWFSEGFYIGWVKGRYLEISKRYKSICGDGVVVIYPDYLFSDRERDGSIKIYYEDTDVCGGTDIFDIQIKLYYSLLDLFTDNNFKSIYMMLAPIWLGFKRGGNKILPKEHKLLGWGREEGIIIGGGYSKLVGNW